MFVSSYTINQSFFKNRINSPVSCGFYVMEIGDKILKKYPISKITKSLFERFYNDFLLNKIGKDITSFIKERVEFWSSKEKNITKEQMKEYVKELFIDKSYVGIVREQRVLKEIQKYIPNDFNITHTSAQEDLKTGVDFLIKKDDFNIGIQVKPISFIYGLKTTTKSAINKLYKDKPKNVDLFIITENNHKIEVHLKKRNSNSLTTISIKTFLSYLDTPNQYKEISNNTLKTMINF